MKVEIINPEEVNQIFYNHGYFACTCYDTSKEYAEKVGESCFNTGHMSGSRCEYIKFEIECDRGTAEQVMRHEIGVRYDEIDKYAFSDKIEVIVDVNPCNIVKNMQSFRYVDKNEFTYQIPKNISKYDDCNILYKETMEIIEINRKKIRDILIEHDIPVHKAVEDANFVLPRATNLILTIGFTPEALIQFMWKRLCLRAQDEIYDVALEMKKKINEICPKFAKELTPQCQHLLWCPESKSCGAYPTKKELKAIIKEKQNENI